MSDWYSASELAGLPGLPTTARGINKIGDRGDLRRRARTRGKGWEYHVASLPVETRALLAARAVATSRPDLAAAGKQYARRRAIVEAVDAKAAQRSNEDGLAKYARLQGGAKTRADAKLAILDALAEFEQRSHLSATKARHKFVTLYNDGEIELPADVDGVINSLCYATLCRWLKAAKSDGIHKLAGGYGNRKGSGKIDRQDELLNFCVAVLAEKPHISAKLLHEGIEARFSESVLDLPSRKGVERWLNTWKAENKQLYAAILSPDAYKNKYMPAFGSLSEDVKRLNQRWELDSTPADVMLTDGRHSILACIDIYSRRVQMHVSKTSTAAAVASVLRRSIIGWGVPESIKTDNGSDYTSKHIKRVVSSLDIEQILSTPFSGWEKGHIERFFRSFSHDLVELLPGYIGHNVADRKEIEDRKAFSERLMKKDQVVEIEMSSAELQAFCDRWVNAYHGTVHGELGVAPAVKAAGQPSRCIEDPRALDVLLANGGMRTVGKKGIRFERGTYIAPELGEWIGEQVMVLYDEEGDLGELFVFGGPENDFICIAEDPEITGISRKEVAAAERARRTKAVQEQKRAARANAKKLRTRDLAEEILAKREAAAKKVSAFPGRTETYDAPGIAAATAAADAREQRDAEPELPPVTEADIKRLGAMIREEQLQAENAESADDRFRRWIRLHRQQEEGQDVDDVNAKWMTHYESTPEFRGRKMVYDDFGASAFGL